MVFTLFSLLTRRASHNGCCGNLRFLYPSNKILLQFSWTQFPVNHNKWPSKRPTLTRDAIQYETKRDFSTSPHSKQNKCFLATTTALNTNESSKYTYLLILTSADRLLRSKSITLDFYLLLALKHNFLLITINGQASARHWQGMRNSTRPNAIYIINIIKMYLQNLNYIRI